MAFDFPALYKTLNERFGEAVLGSSEFRSQQVLRVKRESILAIMKFSARRPYSEVQHADRCDVPG